MDYTNFIVLVINRKWYIICCLSLTTKWLQWLVAILIEILLLFLIFLQPVDESGYSRVKFGAPDLFVRCSIEGKSHNQSILFTLTSGSDDAELESGEIVWRIPAGIKTHAGVVSSVTFISALLSTLFIVLTCIFYSDARMYKTLKQS